jgi:PAS domain S-box-containing protein
MRNSPQEIKLLQSCINDLMSVLALPAIWSRGDSSQVVITLLDTLVGMLRLDFAYARFLENSSEIDILRLAKGQTTSVLPRDVGLILKDGLTNASLTSPALIPNPIGKGEVFVTSLRLGLHDEIGFLVAASKRRDFPTRIETLLLRVAANQAVVGLQEAKLLGAQKQAAQELEQRIAERTRQVTAINAELVREIGVRERAQDELREAKERVEMILESITDNFFALDNEWRFTRFNQHAERQLRVLGKDPASLIGKILWDVFPNPGSAEYLRRAMSDREVITDERYSPILGEWYENRIYPNPDGGLAIFQRYVTQRKQAEQRLLKSEERYRTLFDSIDEGFCTIEVLFDGKDKAVDYRFLEINPSFEKQTGIKKALGRTMREIAPRHEEHWFEIYGKIALTGEPARFQNPAAELHRWFDVYAFRVGKPQERKVAVLFRDITERKRAEQVLRESEERFATIFKASPVAIAITTLPEGRFLDLNDSYLKLIGHNREAVIGHTSAELGMWASLNDRPKLVQMLREQGSLHNTEGQFRTRSGGIRHALIFAEVIELGGHQCVLSLVQDITARQRAEEKLRRSEAYLAEGQRLSHTASWSWNVSTGEVYWSAELFRIYGLDPETTTPGYPAVLDYIHPDDQPRVLGVFEEAVRHQKEYELAYRVVWADGTIRHVNNLAHPVFNEAGALVEYVGTTIDTTERIQAEEELRRSEANLADGQRLSHTGSWTWNVATGECFWSLEHFRLFGLDPENFDPTIENTQRFIHREDLPFVEQTLQRAIRDRTDFEVDYRLVRPDGSIRYHHGLGHPVVRESGELKFVGSVMDVTGRKQAEEELRKTQQELAHVTRVTTVGELTASIAHEVNQPLGAIVTNGHACLRLLSRADPDLDEARAAVECMIEEGMRAGEVIKRIRALVKKSGPGKSSHNINDTIREVIAFAAGELKKNQVTLHTELADDLPLVIADRVQLQQVMLNLILNSNEAMSGSGWQPRELLIRAEQVGPQEIMVTVKDTGPGLDPENRERAFDPFFTSKEGGLGLGLSISKTIIEAHGGKLQNVPSGDTGATFQFSLPVAGESS